mmetsp:Transcript_22937/g.65130  ORF Transcript_22937/g.65130 Transcript_22937/m.65130 type:complete len:702 (-) Transcript_22937:90-2195(-)
MGRLAAVQHNRRGGLVPRSQELLVDDHLGHDRVDRVGIHLKEVAQALLADRGKVAAVREHVRAEGLLLDAPREHVAHLVAVLEEVPHGELEHKVGCLLPVAKRERARGGEDVVAGVLRRASEDLVRVVAGEAAELEANGVLALELGAGHVRHLEEHGRGEEDGVEQVEVDVLVEGHQAALLLLLLVEVAVAVAIAPTEALGKELLLLLVATDLHQAAVGLLEKLLAEGGKAELHHHAVEEDLGVHLDGVDLVLEAAHEQEVTGVVEVIVKSVVVNLADQGAELATGVAVLVDESAHVGHLLDGVEVELDLAGQVAGRAEGGAGVGHLEVGLVGALLSADPAGRVEELAAAVDLGELLLTLKLERDVLVLVVGVLDAQEASTGSLVHIVDALVEGFDLLGKLHEGALVAQAGDVGGRVRVDLAEALGVLVREALKEDADLTNHAHDLVAVLVVFDDLLLLLRLFGFLLLGLVLLVLGVLALGAGLRPLVLAGSGTLAHQGRQRADLIAKHLAEANVRVGVEHAQHMVEVLHDLAPEWWRHVLIDAGADVKLGGDEVHDAGDHLARAKRELHADELAHLLHSLDLVDTLLTTKGDELQKAFLDLLWGEDLDGGLGGERVRASLLLGELLGLRLGRLALEELLLLLPGEALLATGGRDTLHPLGTASELGAIVVAVARIGVRPVAILSTRFLEPGRLGRGAAGA